MTKLNIVIVTYNWPPRNAIGTHRPYAWARHWSEAGADVTVLTAKKQTFDEPLDLNLSTINGVNVIEVVVGGSTRLVGKAFKFEFVKRIAKKLKAWLGKGSFIEVDPRLAWRKAAESTAIRLAAETDIVVSTFGPAASHLIGHDIKMANPSVIWVADYRDLWSQSHTGDITDRARNNHKEIELNTVGAYADLLTAVSEDMIEKLTSLTGKQSLLIPNGFDIDDEALRSRLLRHISRPDGPFRIVYTGMIYEGHRDPTPLLDSLVRLHGANKLGAGEVTIDFYGARVDLVRRLAQNEQYSPFIRIMGHVNRNEALFAQLSADLLLLLESPAPEARGVLTGKLFEYMAAGKPILCVGSRPEYEIGKVLQRTGTGRVFGPDEFQYLDDVLLETFSGKGMQDEYFPRIEEIVKFSRKRQSLELLHVLTKLLERNW
ncbi:glycosyltransferase [Marinobacter salarius]|uniref:glycosyltransferase n=1 Tax=Marinobacter salarius TaxID=1420917 RepID=UPI003D0D0713